MKRFFMSCALATWPVIGGCGLFSASTITYNSPIRYSIKACSNGATLHNAAQFRLAEATPNAACTGPIFQGLNGNDILFVVSKTPETRKVVTAADAPNATIGVLLAGTDGRVYYTPSDYASSPVVQLAPPTYYAVGTYNIKTLGEVKPGSDVDVTLDPKVFLLQRAEAINVGDSQRSCSATLTSTALPDKAATPSYYAAPDMSAVVGRRLTYKVSGGQIVSQVYEVTDLKGESVSFTLTHTLKDGTPLAAGIQQTVKINGVYWPSAAPNPVLADVSTYPQEELALAQGTFIARKVVSADGSITWFSQGLPIKSTVGGVTTELVNVE